MSEGDNNDILECRGSRMPRSEWEEMLPANVKRFKERVEREVPFLREFVEERDYRDLPGVLALEDIKRTFWYFRVFHEASKKITRKTKFPWKDIEKIKKDLEKLHRESWLSEIDSIDIINKLTLSLLQSPLGYEFQLQRDKGLFKQKGGPQKNFPKDFLIYVLVENIKSETGDLKYELICETLYPQTRSELDKKGPINWPDEEASLLDSLADYHAVQKRYQRIEGDFGSLLMNYNVICHSYLRPILVEFLHYLPSELASQFSKLTTPDLMDFLPVKPQTQLS